MRHRTLIVLLALGTVGGYTSGLASLARRARCHGARQARHTTAPPLAPSQTLEASRAAPPPATPR